MGNSTQQSEVTACPPLTEPIGSARVCVTHHYACDCREKAVRELIRDLMELALDNRLDEDERSFVDPARRYVELRNEAVRLGYHHGKIIELSNTPVDRSAVADTVGQVVVTEGGE